MNDTDTTPTCACGRPLRDTATFCDECGATFARVLGDVPWLEDELETTITRAKGVDYRTKGGTQGTERPSPVVWSASDARTHLRGVLIAWTRYSHENHIRNSSPDRGLPAGDMPTLASLAGWLSWRVDGLAFDQFGPTALEAITDAAAKCLRLIDTPAEKQYLGDCTACDTGRLYAGRGAKFARCNECGDVQNADDLKGRLLRVLEDRLYTAAEIAGLSTHFGLKATREQVRKHVEYLGRKNLIEEHPPIEGSAAYRFGEVYQKLIDKDYGKKAS